MTTEQTDRLNGVLGNTAIKTPVAVATTANIALTGEQTIDGVTTNASRVLVKNQTSSIDNGIYISDTGAWSRSTDFDGPNDVVEGTLIKVNGGTTTIGFWYVSTTGSPVPGTDAINFGQSSTVLAVVSAWAQNILAAASAAAAWVFIKVGAIADANTWAGLQTFFDNKWEMADNLDNTKKLNFQLSGITAGQTRVVSPQDRDGTMAYTTDGGNATNGFRLTLTSGTPVTTSDVAAATTIYCTPYKSNKIDLYDGTRWNLRSSAEFSLALGTLSSGLPYDVFCYDNSGVPTLEFLAWTNTTTRATALVYQDGVLSKSGALTRRYLGTFYTISTTQTADSKTVGRFLWNYYHRVIRNTQGTFSSDRTTTSTSYAELNTEIQNKFILGLSEDCVNASLIGSTSNNIGGNYNGTAIAFDSATTANAGFETSVANAATGASKWGVSISGPLIGLAIGYHYATVLGKVDGNTGTWYSATAATTSKTYLQLGIMG